MFIKAYVARIKAGQMTIEQVPEVLRAEVQEVLDVELSVLGGAQ